MFTEMKHALNNSCQLYRICFFRQNGIVYSGLWIREYTWRAESQNWQKYWTINEIFKACQKMYKNSCFLVSKNTYILKNCKWHADEHFYSSGKTRYTTPLRDILPNLVGSNNWIFFICAVCSLSSLVSYFENGPSWGQNCKTFFPITYRSSNYCYRLSYWTIWGTLIVFTP